MLRRTRSQKQPDRQPSENRGPGVLPTFLTIVRDRAKLEGKFDIPDAIRIECEVGGRLKVGGKLVIGEKGVVGADVETVDAIIQGQYEENMVATGNVEIVATGRVSGNIETDSLLIAKGGIFKGNVVKVKDREGSCGPARRPRPAG